MSSKRVGGYDKSAGYAESRTDEFPEVCSFTAYYGNIVACDLLQRSNPAHNGWLTMEGDGTSICER